MKQTFFTALLLMTFSLQASETFLPENLECHSDAKRLEFQQFQLNKINSGKPTMTQFQWLKTEFHGPELVISYQDADASEIQVTFSKQELYRLKMGEIQQISGELAEGVDGAVTILCTELK